jgi:UDP-2-acetamido-3-amino-2,3-dideoxy-glucuronate N-acetyltransferase
MSNHISDTARLGIDVILGYNVVIMDDVVIGDHCRIANNVVIYEGSQIGSNVRIDDNTIIGKKPLSSPRSIFKVPTDLQPAQIGDMCQIGANVIIYAQSLIGSKNLVADMATIRENVNIGDLNIIGRNVTIENFVKIGNRNKLETNCYITAYSEIEDYCFIAPCVATSNDNYMGRDKERFNHFKGVTIKTGGRIGVHATILPGKVIGKDSQVAAGALITKDVTDGKVWVGYPAKENRDVSEKQLLENNLDK